MKTLNHTLARGASFAPLIMRVLLGGLFVLHGVDKFRTGLDNVEAFFASNDVPMSGLTATLTPLLEIGLGVALILGLFTRISAIVLTAVLVGAIVWVKGPTILGSSELDIAYIAGLIGIALLGPGQFSIDEVLDTEVNVIDLRSTTELPQHQSAVS